MFADERSAGAAHRGYVQGAGTMPNVPGGERIGDVAGRDHVSILPRGRGEPRVEPGGGVRGPPDHELGAQHRVDGIPDPLGGQARHRRERRHLASSVNPCVRPAGHGEFDALVHDAFDRRRELALDGPDRRVSLRRPSTEPGPVVRQQQTHDPRHETGLCHRTAYAERSTNSILAMGAPSPLRGPSFRIRV